MSATTEIQRTRTIQWEDMADLSKYKEGTVVEGIPIRHAIFDEVWSYALRQKEAWWKRVDQMARDFEPEKHRPLYYCKLCRRIEDGTRRLMVADKTKRKTIDVIVGRICWDICRNLPELAVGDLGYLSLFKDSMAGVLNRPADFERLEGCEREKWSKFRDIVELRGRTVLDVGCHVGYTCIQSWSRGAVKITGIDSRPEPLEVAHAVVRRIWPKKKANENISHLLQAEFLLKDWQETDFAPQSFDIVFCMGLLHSFPAGTYRSLFAKLCHVCGQTLVIELRTFRGGRAEVRTFGEQSLPTLLWIEAVLNSADFNTVKIFDVRHNSKIGNRNLVIAARRLA